MLKTSVKYKDPFTNEEVTEDLYFHISKADMIEMDVESHKEVYKAPNGEELTGARAKLQRMVDAEDGKALLVELKDILRRAYGKKGEGGRFIKSQALWDDFSSSEAFSQFLWDLYTNPTGMASFINAVFPDVDAVVAELEAKSGAGEASPTAPVAVVPQTTTESRMLTQDEVAAMDSEELKAGLADGRYTLASA